MQSVRMVRRGGSVGFMGDMGRGKRGCNWSFAAGLGGKLRDCIQGNRKSSTGSPPVLFVCLFCWCCRHDPWLDRGVHLSFRVGHSYESGEGGQEGIVWGST